MNSLNSQPIKMLIQRYFMPYSESLSKTFTATLTQTITTVSDTPSGLANNNHSSAISTRSRSSWSRAPAGTPAGRLNSLRAEGGKRNM